MGVPETVQAPKLAFPLAYVPPATRPYLELIRFEKVPDLFSESPQRLIYRIVANGHLADLLAIRWVKSSVPGIES